MRLRRGPEFRQDPETNTKTVAGQLVAYVKAARLCLCVSHALLLSLMLAALLWRPLPCACEAASGLSDLFSLNPTRDVAVSGLSDLFSLNPTRDVAVSAISNTFGVDTRYISSGWASAVSNTFRLDTRYFGSGGGGASTPSTVVRPVVLLVRGLRPTGPPQQPSEYWSSLNSALTQAMPWADIVLVGNDVFDGTGRVAAAGTRLKGLVESYANGGNRDVYIVAHSMGGLVTRSCLSQMGSHRGWVRKVVTLSTPHCGSGMADAGVAVAGIIGLGTFAANPKAGLAYGLILDSSARCQALLDLTTLRAFVMMDSWADDGSGFSLIGGANGGGFIRLLVGAPVLDLPNDGWVSLNSSWGRFWVGPAWDPTTVNTLPKGIKDVLYLNHAEMKSSAVAVSVVYAIISSQMELHGSVPSQLRSPLAALDDPSSVQDVTVSTYAQSLAAGQSLDIPVPIDALQSASFTINSVGTAALSLVTPSNVVLTPASPSPATYATQTDSGLTTAAYTLDNPAPGEWKLRLTAGAQAVDVGGTVVGNSFLALSSTTIPLQSAEACWVTCRIQSATTPVAGATVSATCTSSAGDSTSLTLLDDGAHSDGAASDGIYGARLAAPASDTYALALSANGVFNGLAFSRQVFGSFAVSPETATLPGACAAVGVNEDVDPEFEKVRVTTTLHVLAPSSFQVSGSLAGEDGEAITNATTTTGPLAVGDYPVALEFDADTVRLSGAQSLALQNVVVTDLGGEQPIGVVQVDQLCTFPKPAGDYTDTTAPDSVTSLAVLSQTDTSVTLIWAAPSSEGAAAAGYDLRISEDGFSYSSWPSTVQISDEPAPGQPGDVQTMTVSGLAPGRFYWFCLRSTDEVGNLSALSNPLWAGLVADYSPGMPSGERARYTGVVSAVFPQLAYVQRLDKANGIAVELGPGDVVVPGDLVDVLGNVDASSGERKLLATAIIKIGSGPAPAPLYVRTRYVGSPALGVQCLTNTGLLVKIAGRVSVPSPGVVYVSDGSPSEPGQSAPGVRVLLPAGVAAPSPGKSVLVTGVSTFVMGGGARPAVQLRAPADLAIQSTP